MGSRFGAGAGADMLQSILREKVAQAFAQQKLDEEIRQANMQNTVQTRQLGQGDRRIGLDEQQFGEGKRQFDVGAGQRNRTIALDEQIQPMRIKHIGAQTADLERKPQAEREQREFTTTRDKTGHGYQMEEIGAQGQNALAVANARGEIAADARGNKPPTGAERQTLAFFNRALEGDKTAAGLEDAIADAGLLSQAQQQAPNMLQTGPQQQYRQAQRAFTEARLRKESGAAINPSEYANDNKTYFAQPGDSPEVRKQKRAARQTLLKGLGNASGNALREFYGDQVSLDELIGGGPHVDKKSGGGNMQDYRKKYDY